MASVQLSTKPIGTIVKLRVNGALKDFIIVQRGKPSALYNSAWDTATILLMKEIYENRVWDSNGYAFYSESTIHSVLNNTFVKLLDTTIQNNLLSVKVPYRSAYTGSTVSSVDNGLSTKCFLLSGYEVGLTTSDESNMAVDGSRFAYFQNGTGTTANNLRIANYGSSAAIWWTRTPPTSEGGKAWYIAANGTPRGPNGVIYEAGVRPAIALPNTMMVADDGTVTVNSPPTAPGAPSATTPIKGGSSITVTCGAASDVDGNLSGYIYERAYSGGSFARIYNGSSLTCTDNIAKGWTTVQYRVKAYDSLGAESGYSTSPVYTVINNEAPVISGQDTNLGDVTKTGISYKYTVTDDKTDNVSVVITLNGANYRTQSVKPGVEQTLTITGDDWLKILNGSGQIITIQATDTENASSAIRRITFTKDVDEIDVNLAAEPVAAENRPRRIAVTISADIPDGASVKILACNNGLDEAPAWEDITTAAQKGYAHIFENTKRSANSWAVDVRVIIQRQTATQKCTFTGASCSFETDK